MGDLNIPIVEGRTSQETAYNSLRQGAMIGAFKVGQSLTIRGIATALDMSPTPIREALRRLCAERAMVMLENRRIMIPEFTPVRLQELIETRVSLETFAAIRALPYMNAKKIEALRQLDEEANRAVSGTEHDKVVIANQKFHATLYMTNPEQIVMPMIESIWMQLGPVLRAAAIQAAKPGQDFHPDILQALEARDEDRLVEAMRKDITESVSYEGILGG